MRLNVNKRGLGVSAGVRGMRYSANTSGLGTRSVGIPGTGVYWVDRRYPGKTSSGRGGTGSREARSPGAVVTPATADQLIPKPGLFASSTERRFRDGLVAYLRQDWEAAVNAFQQASTSDTRNLSDDFLLGASLVRLERRREAIACFEKVVSSHIGLPDQLMTKFVPGQLAMQLPITERVTASLAFNSVGAALILAELYQEERRLSDAIGLVQKLHAEFPNDRAITLSLADLLYDDDDFEGIVEVSQGIENTDTFSLAILHLKAKALANQGLVAPAVEVLSACLRRTANRDPDLLKEIRYNRAEAYELLGDKRHARADWTKLVAIDPFYRDARQRLEQQRA